MYRKDLICAKIDIFDAQIVSEALLYKADAPLACMDLSLQLRGVEHLPAAEHLAVALLAKRWAIFQVVP